MSYIANEVKPRLRKLARQGRLLDTAFRVFQREVYPDAAPEQVAALRVAFMGGMGELFAILNAGLDDDAGETDGDLVFMQGWVQELETFHGRTVTLARAGTGRPS